jgi:uncharacterized protein YecE (DUF72 family)
MSAPRIQSFVPARIVVGCTGWSYPEWVGLVYPPGTKPGDFLTHYARAFNFTEVNSSYHNAPARALVEQWDKKTPSGFRFSLKVPKDIVHDKKLAGADEAIEDFLASLTPLRVSGKLERVVCQFTPSFRFGDHFARLESFLERWASSDKFVVELRHDSWWREETYALLRKHDVPLVWSATEHGRTPTVRTSSTLYLRIVGDRALDHENADPSKPMLPSSEITWDRLQRDETPELTYWRDRVFDEGKDALDVFFVINNHLSGFAPQSARLASQLLGVPAPDFEATARPSGQRGLFHFS